LARQARLSDKLTQQGNEVSDLVILAAGHLAMAHGGEGEAKGQEDQHLFHDAALICSGQKLSGRTPSPNTVVSAIPVVTAKARVSSTAIFFMATSPF
jgi:hypothetical protein